MSDAQKVHILRLPQGHSTDLMGRTLPDVLALFHRTAADFLEKYPGSALYYRPNWQVITNVAPQDCPWGHEQYLIGEDGTLGPRATNWDTSG